MFRAFKFLFWLAVVCALGLAGYSMIADLPPPTKDVVIDLPSPLESAE